MKTLTLKQPYATWIAEGIKEYEFRTWKTSYRGDILIHAGKGKNKESFKKYEHLNLEYPSSSIIAMVTIEDCIEVTDEFREFLKSKNPILYSHIITDKDWKGYAFKISNVRKINPIPASGRLSFWEFDINKK